MRSDSTLLAQLSEDPSPWGRPERPPFRPPVPPPTRPTDAPPYPPPEPAPVKRPEPPPWGPWFRSAIALARRIAQPAAITVLMLLPALAHAQVVGAGTDPATIIQAALAFILGDVGIGLATLGFIVMLAQITRFGIGGILIYIGVIAGIFGSAYIVQQILGGA